MANASYNQPVKQRVRAKLLRHAVESLTISRAGVSLVTAADFDRMLDYCVDLIRRHAHHDLSAAIAPLRQHWHTVYASRVGHRLADELKVLILAGPEPLNDLEALTALGVPPENVWAVEGDKNAFRAAVGQLREAGLPLKLHFGSLRDFFAVVPEQFDIVYFDACAPLFGGEPRTHVALKELFLQQRLAPLSALITNFAATPRDNEELWVARLSSWHAPRYWQPVYHGSDEIERVHDGDDFRRHVQTHLEEYYSDFVSRFTIEFAGQLVAWWRVRALGAARRAFFFFADDQLLKDAAGDSFADEERLRAAFEKPGTDDASFIGKLLDSLGHAHLAPFCYPYLVTAKLVRQRLKENDPLAHLLLNDSFGKSKLDDAIAAISLVRNFDEAIARKGLDNEREDIAWAAHNSHACSEALRDLLRKFRWFDSDGEPLHRFFCDTPLSTLTVDLLLGVYGYPYHANISKLLRTSYSAKQATMLSDVFVFDQCRYLYDLVPTLPLFGPEMPHWLQLIIRVSVDLIGRHTRCSCGDLYRGSALASDSEGFPLHNWPIRSEQT